MNFSTIKQELRKKIQKMSVSDYSKFRKELDLMFLGTHAYQPKSYSDIYIDEDMVCDEENANVRQKVRNK